MPGFGDNPNTEEVDERRHVHRRDDPRRRSARRGSPRRRRRPTRRTARRSDDAMLEPDAPPPPSDATTTTAPRRTSDAGPRAPRRHRLGPADPRLPRRRSSASWCCSAPSTCCSAPTSAPASASCSPSAALFGWMDDHGRRSGGSSASACSARRPHWEVEEVVYPRPQDDAATRGGPRARHLASCRRLEEFADLDEERARGAARTTSRPSSAAGSSSRSPTRLGEAKATVDGTSPSEPDAELGDRRTPTRLRHVYVVRERRQGAAPRRPEPLGPHLPPVQDHVLELQHPPHYAIIQVQPVIEQETEPGQPPPPPEADRDKPVSR